MHKKEVVQKFSSVLEKINAAPFPLGFQLNMSLPFRPGDFSVTVIELCIRPYLGINSEDYIFYYKVKDTFSGEILSVSHEAIKEAIIKHIKKAKDFGYVDQPFHGYDDLIE